MQESYDQHLLLATLPPSRRQIRAAYGVVIGLLAAFCLAVPFAHLQLHPVPAFIPIYVSLVAVNDLITSLLLFAQFWVARQKTLLVLGGSYFFAALIIIPYALTFPGIFTSSGLLGAGLQTAAWLYTCWHLGSPIALIASILVKGRKGDIDTIQRPTMAIVQSVAIVIVTVCGLTWGIIAADALLPPIFLDATQLNHRVTPLVGGGMILMDAIALAMLCYRGRSVLELWLAVMCCAWLIEILLGSVLMNTRYSLAWYTGRMFGLVATFIVLSVLLSEATALYVNLARSAIQQRSARQARQINMDAMAAAIGHEIRQPLSVIVTDASVGAHLLESPAPNIREAQTIFANIITQASRVNKMIGDIRSMFKKSTHGRVLVNANDAIRDALALAELELRQSRIVVTTKLTRDLPYVLADYGQLQQVLLNLITNAIEAMHFMADRPSILRVSSNIDTQGSAISISVEDTGTGITEADSQRIFDPFFSTKPTGTGIGLTICQIIIESHGGSLLVSKNEPHGTIFRAVLPLGGYDKA